MAVDPPSEVDDFDRLVGAWNHSRPMHTLRRGADEAAIQAAEDRFGRPLPNALRRLIGFSDGLSIAGGNLTIESISGVDGEDVVGMSSRLRGWGWPIPDDVLAIGTNGQGAILGLWYPRSANPDTQTPVILMADPSDSDYMSVAGSDLTPFLKVWSAFYLVLGEAPSTALDAIGVPNNYRVPDPDLARFVRWGDPRLGERSTDPFEARLDLDGLASAIDRL